MFPRAGHARARSGGARGAAPAVHAPKCTRGRARWGDTDGRIVVATVSHAHIGSCACVGLPSALPLAGLSGPREAALKPNLQDVDTDKPSQVSVSDLAAGSPIRLFRTVSARRRFNTVR